MFILFAVWIFEIIGNIAVHIRFNRLSKEQKYLIEQAIIKTELEKEVWINDKMQRMMLTLELADEMQNKIDRIERLDE